MDFWKMNISYQIDEMCRRTHYLRNQFSLILKAAYSDSLILISGEKGTEKEHIARLIHTLSRGGGAPFIRIDCEEGSLNPDGELSWYRWRERIRNGSIFLNRIERLSRREQLCLKTILENEIFSNGTTPGCAGSAFRLLLGSGDDLRARMKAGTFLPALYYTMNVVEIMVPPLRLREEDIIPLAYLVLESREEESEMVFFPEVLSAFQEYSWPGNFEELSQTIAAAAESAAGTVINLRDLPPPIRGEKLALATS